MIMIMKKRGDIMQTITNFTGLTGEECLKYINRVSNDTNTRADFYRVDFKNQEVVLDIT